MKNISYKSNSYELPFKITCTVSGVIKTYTSVDYINKKIDQHNGSLDAFRAAYVSKSAKKLVKPVAPVVVEAVAELVIAAEIPSAPALIIPIDTPVTDSRPIAKRYANGTLRNLKGHPIKKGTEEQYQVIAA